MRLIFKKITILFSIGIIFIPNLVLAFDPWEGLKNISINNKEDYKNYCNASGAADNVKLMRCDVTVYDPKGAATKFQFDAIKKTYSDYLLVNDKRLDMEVKLKLNYSPTKDDYSIDGLNFFYKEYGNGNKTEYGQASCQIITHCCCASAKDAAGNVTGVDEKNCKQTFCDCGANQRNITFCGTEPKKVTVSGSTTETVTCGTQKCTKTDKECKIDSDCTGYNGIGVCKNSFCFLDPVGLEKYKATLSAFGVQADIQIKKPVLEINIPQLKFSEVQNTIDSEGYIHIPYIGEYISAVYKVAMVIVSIIGVIMIIIVGVKITVMGGEEKVNGFKKIGQVVIGLLIAWGSYAILYNINPDLVQFKSLKVKYIVPEQIPDIPDDDDSDAPDVSGVPKLKICNTYETCKPFCSGKEPNLDKINAAATAKGIKVPEGIVEIPPLLRSKFQVAGCTPKGVKDSQSEFLNCGLLWHNGKAARYSLASTADGIVKAALKAKSQGYGISIGTLVRPLSDQFSKVCGWIARNPDGPVKICQNAADNSPKPKDANGQIIKGKDNGLACPGTTNHFSGVAADLNLFSLTDTKHTPLTAQTGTATACETNAKIEAADQNYLKLNEVMFSTGWWKFCQEKWHFEYVSQGGPMRKNKTAWP